MTGDPRLSSSTVQPAVQHRPAPSGCITGQERGLRCLPVVPGSPYCDNHNPDRRERRREITKRAARASHPRRVSPELEAWADTIDLTTDEGRARSLTEVAQLVVREELRESTGNTIAALARAAAGGKAPKPAPVAPLLIEVERYSNSHPGPAS